MAWRKHNCWIFYTNPGLKQRGEPKAYKASSHSTSAPLVPPGAWGPGYTSATVFLCMRKNLASDKLIDTQNFLHLKSKWKNQTGIISARKDRKTCLVCTTTFCEFFTANQNRQKIKITYEQTWLSNTRTGGRLIHNSTVLRIFLKMKLSNARPSKFLNHHKTYFDLSE